MLAPAGSATPWCVAPARGELGGRHRASPSFREQRLCIARGGLLLLCLRQKCRRRAGFAAATEKPQEKPREKPREKYGPKDGFASETRLRSWLQSKGCRGLELLDLGKSQGVWLKPQLSEEQLTAVAKGGKVVEVPASAWITAEVDGSADIEEALAAELLHERAKGPKSQFSAYVDFLWRRDLSHHPMFWTQEELAWLSACGDVQQAVLELQERTRLRAENLRRRFPKAPKEDLSFALCLVECRAISSSSGGALVPVLDHLRNDSTGSPAVIVGDEGVQGGPMVAVSLQDLDPCFELRNCFDTVSDQELFTQYGEVQIKGGEEDVVPEANVYNEVLLPVRVPAEHWRETPKAVKKAKLGLLQRRLGLDLAGKATLRLPMDAISGGRLLPLARFVHTPVPVLDREAKCEELFDMLFKDCHPSLLPGNEDSAWGVQPTEVPPAPANLGQLKVEVQARILAAEWYESCLASYNRMSDRIYKDLEDGYLSGAGSGSQEIQLAEITEAYYKAKRKDGKTGRSKAPKQCRVLSPSPEEGTVTVQFLENGVRQTIPEDWLKTDAGPAAQEPSVKRQRGLLGLALLACQQGMIQGCYQLMMEVLQLGQDILARSKESERAALAQQLPDAWQREHDIQARVESAEL